MAVQIEIDDEVWELLKERAEPLVDTPNSVVRRLLGLPGANGPAPRGQDAVEDPAQPVRRRAGKGRRTKRKTPSVPRAQSGTILADDEYELPILAILDEHGGRAPTREVLEDLGSRLNGKLLPADHEALASGEIRWRNRAQFVRLRLIERGDMKKGSPRGVWEISDQGRDRLVAA